MRTVNGLLFIVALFWTAEAPGQLITASPAFPVQTDSVTITFDATLGNQGLKGYTGDVYAHAGVITSESADSHDWKHAPVWGDNSAKYKLERIATDLYQLHIVPSIDDYYGTNPGEVVNELAFVFRSADNSREGKTETGGDIFYPVYVKGLNVTIVKPDRRPLIVEQGDTIIVEAQSQDSDSLILIHHNQVVKKTTGLSLTDTIVVETMDKTWIKAVAKNDTGEVADSVYYFPRPEAAVLDLPDGVEDGINYLNDTAAVLVLFAPGKQFVYVIGSFNDWEINNQYLMNVTPDGERFWFMLDSLEPAKEYLFQYLVDGNLRIDDPYAEKVCDPLDIYISANTYPGLLPYPEGKTNGIISYLQTAQTEYDWKHTDFTAPPTDKLVIYELLIRDFIAKHDYKTLADTLDYFERLGINAIELMPVFEFEGNSSWGYNISHYFAPDKYYGPKKDLQAFIDSAHARGIAVILDIVLNHSFGQSPMVRLYWDSENNRPAADNPWFNPIPKHEFNVGYDMNHESAATRYFVNRFLRFWLGEYHVDGYRFDLSKGLTQKNTLGDADAFARYDASRVAILETYADTIWQVNPETYVILEHFADNDEEQVLTDYGMMVWGNEQYNYGRAGMGWNYDGKSDFSWGSWKARNFSKPHLVTYMESHDEQRQMYDILRWGNYENPNYNVRDNLEIGLVRGELCSSFFFTLPGPKMVFEFWEMGYDYTLFYNNDKLGPKPIRWDFLENPNRQRLFQVGSALIHLKQSQPVFNTRDFSFNVADTMKTIQLRSEDMDVTVIGNFDTRPGTIDPSFTKTGTWYDYFSGDSLVVTDTHAPIDLDKSEYRIYTSVRLETPDIISAPRATEVTISGSPGIGEELTGQYTYSDLNGDPEGETRFKWYRGIYPDGANKTEIPGADANTYTVTGADWNNYLFFEVTPVAATGDLLEGISEYGILDLAVPVPPQDGLLHDIRIYPNPANEDLHVRIGRTAGEQVILELYDIEGKMVSQISSGPVSETKTGYTFHISELSNGIYFLKIKTGNELAVRRIIKL